MIFMSQPRTKAASKPAREQSNAAWLCSAFHRVQVGALPQYKVEFVITEVFEERQWGTTEGLTGLSP